MSKIHFEKLTPVKNADLKIYSDALDFVFENNDIKNVAISGAYGAGKSSVIESYKQKHDKLRFLHISLANFETDDNDNLNNKESEVNNINSKNADDACNESVLEGKILNQLLHQIDVSKIPQTNFRVKQQISNKSILKITLITVVFLLCILHIHFYSKWCIFISSFSSNKLLNSLSITTKKVSLLFSGFLIIVIVGLGIYKIAKMQINKSIFKSFKFQGNEIEIFEKCDESYFDKYLNEVLYLFENAYLDRKYVDVIVFEDIDRYNVNQIFQRLREVNLLINSKRKRYGKEPMRFFYLLRDDVFISKDRTKFFDFIIPVVPVIDSSNSYDQFLEHFSKGGVLKKFDKHFLQGVSLYVDDMRILKNIYNEFIVYYNRISTTEQDYNKLLAIIVYKNIFPRDFSDTQLNKGFVSTIFNRKDEFINEEYNRINKQIKEISEKVELCNKEHLDNINELNKIYTIYNCYGNAILEDKSKEYIDRKETIMLIKNKQVDSLKNKIHELETKKVVLKNRKMQNIITRENIDDIFSISYKNFLLDENNFNEIKSSHYFYLLKYLIRNGYLDETYEDYMTYFYPNSLTANDKMFLRSVTDKKKKDWAYKIDNPQLVLSRLRETDFGQIEVLNFSLFSYILNTQNVNEKYLIRYIEQLKNTKQYSFVERYFCVIQKFDIFVKTVNHYWTLFLYEIANRSEFSYEQKKAYIILTLYYCDSKDIDLINSDNFLAKIISCDSCFLDIGMPEVEKLTHEFLRLNIKFKSLNYEKSNKNLFNAVYENKLYEFTFENITIILKNIYNLERNEEIWHKNYSLIMERPTSKLSEYVHENIDQYMTIEIDNCDGSIDDYPKEVLELINNEDISFDKKKNYIENLNTQIEKIENVKEKKLWDLLLQNELVQYTEINILYYYFNSGNGLNKILINFIQSNSKLLQFSKNNIDEEFGDNSSLSLFKDVIKCISLSNEKYTNLICELNYVCNDFIMKDMPEDKIKILIRQKVIKMTSKNFIFMRTSYPSQFISFIEQNILDYMTKVLDENKLTYDELIKVLSLNIDDKFKIDLISHTNKSIQSTSNSFSDDVKKYILLNNFDQSELPFLIKGYITYSDSIKDAINGLCTKLINIVVECETNLPDDLFQFLLSTEDISTENKLILLTKKIANISKSECENYFNIINLKEYLKLFGSGRPKLEVNEINKNILEEFKNKHWISDFSQSDNYFKITRRNLHNIQPI